MKVSEYVEIYTSGLRNKSADEYERRLNKYLVPRLGGRLMANVSRKDIVSLHKSINAPTEANMVIRITSAMFGQAELDGIIKRSTNPCFRIPMNKETKRKEFMTNDQVKVFLNALDQEPLKYRAFFTILLYTGARESEIRQASWSDIDGNVLWLSDSKTGSKEIYLPDQAVELLKEIEPKDDPIFDFAYPQFVWNRIRRRCDMPWLRMHDLRRTFASIALSNGITLDQVGRLLGHRSTQTTHRYAYLAGNQAKESVNKIAEFIDA